MSDIRVRFAPSPTGYFHIGSARTALFNWLYARSKLGVFILRIEDTDKKRNTTQALKNLYDGMNWLGLNWDEGPNVGGNFGPYFQSNRNDIYYKYLQKLKDNGLVYNKEGAIFFKVSKKKEPINDLIRSNMQCIEEKDFIIFRSNGSPVFHFTNVVDDITMKITHIIRGEDHLPNTGKHIELFKAFNEKIPTFAHIPLILKSNSPGKMSKRDLGACVHEYKDRYFLKDAVKNYLCLLGWSPKNNQEILPIQEIINLFDINKINKNNAYFNEKKLKFFNMKYLRNISLQDFSRKVKPILKKANLLSENIDENYLKLVLEIVQKKIVSLENIVHFISYFFTDNFKYDSKIIQEIMKDKNLTNILQYVILKLKDYDNFTPISLEKCFKEIFKTFICQPRDIMMPVRVSVSGMSVGPNFYSMLSLLGKKRIINRITFFLKKKLNNINYS